MIVREVIQLLIDDYAKGVPSDDSRLRNRRVFSALKNARAEILKDRNATSEANYTTLGCVELEQVEASTCSCIPNPGCYYYRTKCQLPTALGEYQSSISDVTTIDGKVRFSKIDWSRVDYINYDTYTAKKPRYFIRNGYLYLINVPKLLKVITVRGMFEDIDINCFMCEASNCVSPLDMPFPLERKYVRPTLMLAYQQLFSINTTEDGINNKKDDNQPTVPPAGNRS